MGKLVFDSALFVGGSIMFRIPFFIAEKIILLYMAMILLESDLKMYIYLMYEVLFFGCIFRYVWCY